MTARLDPLAAAPALMKTWFEASLAIDSSLDRTLAELVDHRFVYRPHVTNPVVPHVERRSAELHLARLAEEERIEEVEAGRWRALD